MMSPLAILERSFRRIDLPQRAPSEDGPRLSGVYMLVMGPTITYVGSSSNVTQRLWSHVVENRNKGTRRVLRKNFKRAIWHPIPSKLRRVYEGAFIRFLNPEHNIGPAPSNADHDDEIVSGFGLNPTQRPAPEILVSPIPCHPRRKRFAPSCFPNEYERTVHDLIINRVAESGLKIREIADRLGWPARKVYRMLDGTIRLIVDDAVSIGEVLGLSIDDIFGEDVAWLLKPPALAGGAN